MREDYIMRKMEFIDDIQKCIPQIDAENGKYQLQKLVLLHCN